MLHRRSLFVYGLLAILSQIGYQVAYTQEESLPYMESVENSSDSATSSGSFIDTSYQTDGSTLSALNLTEGTSRTKIVQWSSEEKGIKESQKSRISEEVVGKTLPTLTSIGKIEQQADEEEIADAFETDLNLNAGALIAQINDDAQPTPNSPPLRTEDNLAPPLEPFLPNFPIDTDRSRLRIISPSTDPNQPPPLSPNGTPTTAPTPANPVTTPSTVAPAIPQFQNALPPTAPTTRGVVTATDPTTTPPMRHISVNFNNVSMIEYIRFISRITDKNFIFDESDLQFNVTIISEEPTSIDNLMSTLLQELRIRDLLLIEQGNNIIIHRNPKVRAPGHIVADNIVGTTEETELVTQIFRLNTLDPVKVSDIIRPLLSAEAIVDVLRDSNNLIVTDLVSNVNKIAQLIGSLDAPNSGMTIGQYVVRNSFVDSLLSLAEKILQPIAQGNPFILVPHPPTNSIFIVSNPFIVERALAILENLDINEGRTKILSLERFKLQNVNPATGELEEAVRAIENAVRDGERPLSPGEQRGDRSERGERGFGGEGGEGGEGLYGSLGRPGPRGAGSIFDEGREFVPGMISPHPPRWMQELPAGHIERTLFFIYKVKYRQGDQVEIALRRIANSLLATGSINEDLVSAINSVQWIEASNSLVFTGTAAALDRVKELVNGIDLPLRQVLIEMLILDASIDDALQYGVDWLSRFGGGETAGAEAFLGDPSSILQTSANQQFGGVNTNVPTQGPIANALTAIQGFSLGVIGTHLTHNGTRFNTIGALVRAVHTDTKSRIVFNPKIITEDNHTAEIFVGSTTRFKTQSISNDFGTVITNNFQFLDVGTTLRVTPLIGNNDVITLDIIEEITNASANANPVSNAQNIDVNLIPVLTKNRTTTRIHVPNGFFVVLSGLIQNTEVHTFNRVPCLGGIPIIGAINKQKANTDSKRNLMLFIRPLIVDTAEELEYLTKRQQDIFDEKFKFRRSWNYEIDEALDFANIKPTDQDEIGCTIR